MLIFSFGCGKNQEETKPTQLETATKASTEASTEKPTEKPKKKYYTNPLTGVKDLDKGVDKRRPVAIMINNLSTAQRVQTGVGKADIVYETEVEGGITRLMAVYQDVSKVECIGTIRSARYAYIDLAMGHNAVYVHHGADNVYAGPHLGDVNRIEVSDGRYGKRISNGLSMEHTLYAYGEPLWQGIKNTFNTENSEVKMWQDFAPANQKIKPADGVANSVIVPFSYSYNTKFVYEKESGKYVRNFGATTPTDYRTGEKSKFKNVVVLLTPIGYYSNGKHRQISLNGGSGYYVSNGRYQKINWSKGSASSPFVFTNTDGSKLKMNSGNTWVCIASNSYSYPSFN